MLGPDAFYTSRRAQIVSFAAHYAVPVMYIAREFTQAGGLICYGPDLANAYRETGTYTGRLVIRSDDLRGAHDHKLEQSARRLGVETDGESHGARGAGEFRCMTGRYLQIDDGAALRAALVEHLLQDWIERLRQWR